MRWLSASRTGSKQNKTLRLFKQLEFLVVGQALRLPDFCSRPALSGRCGHGDRAPWLQRRDHAFESQARELLRQLGAEELARKIRVEWNPRMRTCAGRADYRKKLISLNPLLSMLADDIAQNERGAGKLDRKNRSGLASASHPPRHQRAAASTQIHFDCANAAIRDSRIGADVGVNTIADEIERTLRHELAHLLAQWRVGRRRISSHGPEWRQACRDLGIADEARCHNLPFVTKVYPPRYVYRCPNCKEEFPRVRRIRRAIACLACCRKHNGGDFDSRFRLKMEGHAPSCP